MVVPRRYPWRRFLPATLLLAAVLAASPTILTATPAEDEPRTSLGKELDELRDKAMALEKEAKDEADAEHYEEAVQLLRSVKEILEEREGLLKEHGRAATSPEELGRFSKGLEENTEWFKRTKDLINLLKLAL